MLHQLFFSSAADCTLSVKKEGTWKVTVHTNMPTSVETTDCSAAQLRHGKAWHALEPLRVVVTVWQQ